MRKQAICLIDDEGHFVIGIRTRVNSVRKITIKKVPRDWFSDRCTSVDTEDGKIRNLIGERFRNKCDRHFITKDRKAWWEAVELSEKLNKAMAIVSLRLSYNFISHES